jgi:hypothetical protein
MCMGGGGVLVWGDCMWAGPGREESGPSPKRNLNFGFDFFKLKQTFSFSKGGLLELKKIQIKYVCEGFETRNNFPY